MGLDLDEKFGTNPKAEIEGVWIPLGDGARVKVARFANKQATRAYRSIPKAARMAIETGDAEGGPAQQFMARHMAEHVLRDWEGLAEGGKPLPDYDPEIGYKVLLAKRRFRERIYELSCDEDLFNTEAEADAKNLPGSSSGGLSTTKTQS